VDSDELPRVSLGPGGQDDVSQLGAVLLSTWRTNHNTFKVLMYIILYTHNLMYIILYTHTTGCISYTHNLMYLMGRKCKQAADYAADQIHLKWLKHKNGGTSECLRCSVR